MSSEQNEQWLELFMQQLLRFSHSHLLSDFWEDDEAFLRWKPRGEKSLDIVSWKSEFVLEGGGGGGVVVFAGVGGGGGGGIAKPAAASEAVSEASRRKDGELTYLPLPCPRYLIK